MSYEHVHQGKVRDLYDAGDGQLLMVASDRISAFDVVMGEPIPDKGRMLTAMSAFWFETLAPVAGNHLVSTDLGVPAGRRARPVARRPDDARAALRDGAGRVRGARVPRRFRAGRSTRPAGRCAVCACRPGLQEADRLPKPIFTPTTKAPVGTHDEAMTFDDVVATIGGEQAEAVRSLALAAYRRAAAHTEQHGILLADTKFELGYLDGELVLADEVLTPDSSRFWPADGVAAGHGAAVVRQAARARRAGGVGVDEGPAAAAAVARYRRRHPPALRGGLRAAVGTPLRRLARIRRYVMTDVDAFHTLRDGLLAGRTHLGWPGMTHFNWALDHFDAVGGDRPALWIVEEDGTRGPPHLRRADRPLEPGRQLPPRPRRRSRRPRAAHAGQRRAAVGDDARRHEARRRHDPGVDAARPGRPRRPGRAGRRQGGGGRARPRAAVRRRARRAHPGRRRATTLRPAGSRSPTPTAPTPPSPPTAATAADDPLLLYFTSGTTSQAQAGAAHPPQLSGRPPVDHVLDRAPAGRRPPQHLLAGLGQARVELLLRPVERRGDGLPLQLRPLRRPGAARHDGALRRHHASAPRRRSGACSSRRTSPAWDLPLRELVGAGEPLNPEVIEQVKAAWGLTIRDGYGQTETTAQIGNAPGMKVKPGSMGRPLPGYTVALLDADGKRADEGEISLDLSTPADRPDGRATSTTRSAPPR